MKKSELKAIIKECIREEFASGNLDEGIFGFGKKKAPAGKSAGNKACKVTFKIYDPNGRLQFNWSGEELPGKKTAEEQVKEKFMEYNSVYQNYKNNNPTDWTFERTSNPASPKDTTGSNKHKKLVAADLRIPY